MNKSYFELGENFEEYMKNSMTDKKIKKCKFIPTGWTNIVYEVETNEGNFFFRFPRDEFWSRTIVKDYEFSKFIQGKTKCQTVKLELKYESGRPFSMHKKIEGTPLAEKMNILNDSEVEKISGQIAEFMNEIHKVEKNSIAFKEEFKVNDISTKLPEFLDELLKKHVSNEDQKFWNKKDIENNEICFVHGDLNSSNILLDSENNMTAVIDFGFAGYGNKYNDIARIIGRCPDKFKNSIINSYEKCSETKIDKDYLDTNINVWNNIDNAYINYMKTIGIYN